MWRRLKSTLTANASYKETDGSSGTPQPAAGSGTPLRIPYGNKELAFRSGRSIRDGRLVCAFRRGSCRLSRAGMAVEAPGRRRGGGAPAGILTGMPTTADNRGPGMDSGWLGYDDGYWCQAGRDARDRLGIQHVTARRTMTAGEFAYAARM